MSCEHCTDPDARVAMLQAGEREDVVLMDPRRSFTPRTSWVYEHPNGVRQQVTRLAPMRHVKTGGKYIVTGFPVREATMEQGFDYFSIATKETFWRPIGELFDGRFEFITMEELCSTN